MGAMGAHFLEAFLQRAGIQSELIVKRLDQFDVGARYHLIHSVALLALASVTFGSPRSRRYVARLFLAGIILFSGSLYMLVMTNTPKWGIVTPIGGFCWIIGWLGLIWVSLRTRNHIEE